MVHGCGSIRGLVTAEARQMSDTTTDFIRRRSIRMETYIVIAKGAAHLIVGIFTPWSAALAQWVNSGDWPTRIVWIGVILPASAVGGSSALLAFLSGSYQTYQKLKQDNDQK